ncbi:MAG TPA: restriction endonuclease subunit S [Flavobacterium sp.]|jgi:type I restriction enzyme S subunit
MNYLEKLLDGVEVEWKFLSNVGNVVRGKRLTKKELTENGNFPVFHGGLIPLGLYHKYNRSANQTMIINTGSVGEVVWSGVDFWSSDGTFVVDTNDNVENKYLYYLLKTQEKYLKSQKREGGVPTIDRITIENLQIPIPPIKIQQEIVRILDTFTGLTAELTAELTARKKQYSFYREQLFSFDDREVGWKSLGEVATIGTGSRNTNESVIGGEYPFFVRSQEPRAINEYEFDETAIITAGDGVGVGKVFHYITGKYALHQRAYRIVVTNQFVTSRYLFHFMRINFAKYLEMTSVHASVTSLRKPMFEKYRIPVPSLQEQNRIVSILDKFDTLTTSISEGLPKEIDLRKKQYEYYRNLLLTFPKPDAK